MYEHEVKAIGTRIPTEVLPTKHWKGRRSVRVRLVIQMKLNIVKEHCRGLQTQQTCSIFTNM